VRTIIGGAASGESLAAERWLATTICQGDHRFIATLAGLTTRREAQEILRRSQRIANVLDGQSHDEKTVQAIYQLLSQEGDLVGELVEEIVVRSSRHCPLSAGDGSSPSSAASQP
jgi:hypothetical protein